MTVASKDYSPQMNTNTEAYFQVRPPPLPGQRWNERSYFFLLVTTATLMLRPSDFFQTTFPYFLISFGFCLLFGAQVLQKELTLDRILNQPIVTCMMGVALGIFLSQVSHLNFERAILLTLVYFKTLAYVVMVFGLIKKTERLENFCRWLLLFIFIGVTVSVLQFNGLIHLENFDAAYKEGLSTFDENGKRNFIYRLKGVGIFSDPNDFCLILQLGIALALLIRPGLKRIWTKLATFFILGEFFYALLLTRSRGGFIALIVGGCVLLIEQYGIKKIVFPLLILGPLVFGVFAGRQTNIDLSNRDDTAQHRIQLWSEGFRTMAKSPLFGLGANDFQVVCGTGLVAHNSYVHAFSELGIFGGSFFFGIYFYIITAMRKVRPYIPDEKFLKNCRRLFYVAIIFNAFGLLSLSRVYTQTTYILPALVISYLQIIRARTGWAPEAFSKIEFYRLLVMGCGVVAIFQIFILSFAQWGGGFN